MCDSEVFDQTHYDCIVLGTSLVPCIVGAALARVGKKVIHIDRNESYGGVTSSVSLADFDSWTASHQLSAPIDLIVALNEQSEQRLSAWQDMCKDDTDKIYTFTACPSTEARADNFFAAEHQSQTAVLNQPLLKRARQFNIDLTPQLLYSRGEFVDVLVRSAVSKYLEFRCLDTTYTYVDQRFQRVPCTKSEVFGSDLLSMIEKRLLMKLSHVVFGAAGEDPHAQDAVNKSDLQPFMDKPFLEFLKSQKLSPKLQSLVAHALCYFDPDMNGPESAGLSTSIGIERMRKFQRSLGRYGPGAFLYTLYGIADIPQGFARLCAIFGGTFVLRHAVQAIVTAPAEWTPLAEPVKKEESSESSPTTETTEDSNVSDSSQCNQAVSTSPAPLLFPGNGRRFRGVLSAGGQLLTANCLVADSEYVPNYVDSSSTICRCAILTDRPLSLQANVVSDSCAMFVIYPNTFGNRSAVRILQFDSTSSMCGADTYLIHMSVACNAPEDLRCIVDTLFAAISHAEQPESPSSSDGVSVESTVSADPRPRILWRASWSQTCRRAHSNDRVPSNVFVCTDPDHELGFTAAVQQAESIFKTICPDAEFLPQHVDASNEEIKDKTMSALANLSDDEGDDDSSAKVESISTQAAVDDLAETK